MKRLFRKRRHLFRIENYLYSLEIDVINAALKAEYSNNKNISIVPGNIENKVKLIKKYQRRIKLLRF
jgi:hypothetical protein